MRQITDHVTPVILVLLLGVMIGCSPIIKYPGPAVQNPEFNRDNTALVMADGMALPLHTWLPENAAEASETSEAPLAVVLALHGFNDYGTFFAGLAQYLNQHNIAAYAYDQRGFGANADAGYWAGREAYLSDARAAIAMIRARHPGVPVFGFGESMGGAVLMAAAGEKGYTDTALLVDGLILAAPAIWARETMPWYQQSALWFAIHTMPGLELGGQGLDITPSDNIEMLRALGRDPLVIKDTRVDAIWGVVNLMDKALDSAGDFHTRALILYGERDEIIRQEPTRAMLARLPETPTGKRLIATYENGYHMLIRDLGAQAVWDDILAWIRDPDITTLPSGGEQRAGHFIAAMEN